jgi:exopolyphosphatase/guanosine-5'-triphosphate,3'-diphosphate pyrophosphatase
MAGTDLSAYSDRIITTSCGVIVTMLKIASIDIGTNSVLYSLFEVRGRDKIREAYFERHSPRIGRHLSGRKKPVISKEAYADLKKILVRHIGHAIRNDAQDIVIAATSPLRLARNGRQIRKQLQRELGHRVTILSPEREAYLSFLGGVGRLPKSRSATMIDMGGGSTEFLVYRGSTRQAFLSIPEGAVSLTEKFDSQSKVNADDFPSFERILLKYGKRIDLIEPRLQGPVYLVGGTSTALASLKDKSILAKRKGVVLTRKDVDRFVNRLGGMSLTGRRRLLTIDKKRAEIIFAGAFWYRHLFKVLDIKSAHATPWGLRHGMALDFLEREVFPA